MTVSMYKVSVPIFVQFLTAQCECIDKAIAHIEAKQLDPIHSRHPNIGEDEVGRRRCDLGECRGRIARGPHVAGPLRDGFGDRRTDVVVVIHDENAASLADTHASAFPVKVRAR